MKARELTDFDLISLITAGANVACSGRVSLSKKLRALFIASGRKLGTGCMAFCGLLQTKLYRRSAVTVAKR